ncbi:1-acyl-sn-glycerol-3-phosphate acyltransferase [Nocardia terpenica]|uniref:Acyl-phosphate glycerol 3-phosphate acyltransferase n=1 Tax=Nocardia terpenica TaxID=455432 RepID=A0A164MY79_9NOCA|nr:lysophospholipid acyltransferase family protein [Nocardia terpenica]KZM73777.1 acyl-phosphate glycerol 3-phosphate acyltransferase [Nocardia terpenica]MBF6064513.1 1-acyl-sn-glycerol-3-phosphate acyltransferase [Nocardia terpenica]MBF6106863.1 1-acyl-sn-glycerol-3-phosphate acyltransferase [Nocardia terpenica]MBF6114481.1 1-acyl-sn-glycerol-3-phosphate acyltransferase [Nocardia terpenica]MBF6121433.1 1-acyl-sn-glycerol-3-phosphate acyltransferase [Nocardia terpenica]
MFYWLLKYVFPGPFMHLYNRPKAEGVEHIPADGPAILAGNHLSFTDWLFTPLMSPRRITYLAKAEYFTTPGLKGRLQKFFFSGTGQYPIDRTGADAAVDALNTARRLLEQGRLVGLYPEGTRSPDGRLYKGKTGVARLALETGVPVIPVALIGTDEVCPPGPFTWRRRRVTVKFGAPIDFSRYEGMGGNRFVERAVTDEIMYELMRMSGREYVDVYAASLKKGVPSGPRPDADRVPETMAS